MFETDDLLQQKLDALENGAPLETVLADLPEDAEDLALLIQLAVAVRQLPHPRPSLAKLRAQKYVLVNTIRSRLADNTNGRPKSMLKIPPRFELPTLPSGLNAAVSSLASAANSMLKSMLKDRIRFELPTLRLGLHASISSNVDNPSGMLKSMLKDRLRFEHSSMRLSFAPALVAVLLLALISTAGLVGAGILAAGPHNAQIARLTDVEGAVMVSSADPQAEWQAISNGDRVHAGQRLRTGPGSSATLVFFEGSQTTLGPQTDLGLTRVDGDWGKVLQVVLNHATGRISNDVVPLRGNKSTFMVFTPSGVASVHGTNFSVAVDPLGKSRFAVERGRVLVTNENSEVFLSAGQTTTAASEETLENPQYQFSLQGELSVKQGSTWIVAGIPFTVEESTTINDESEIGDLLRVEGRVLENGTWAADMIEATGEREEVRTYTGTLETMGDIGTEWQISGWNLLVKEDTHLDENLAVGDPVRVTFRLTKAGSWQALSIELLEEPAQEPSSDPTDTPDPDALPVLSMGFETTQAAICGEEFEFKGILTNESLDDNYYAAGVKLDKQVTAGAQYVDSVEISPSAWEKIEAGESQEFEIKVELNNDWKNAENGEQAGVLVFVASETNNPDGQDARLTITITKNCEAEGTEPVASETPTDTIAPSTTLEPTEEAFTDCTGAQPHPTGTKLADRYKVDYEEIMEWFCQGFGFGEIDLAYGLSRQYNVPVEEIFALKSSGLGWGQIKKMVPTMPTITPTPSITPTVETAITPTVTTTITATEAVTPTETPAPEETEEPTELCTGAQPHPTGSRLAFQYGVPYEEIMGWFCQGFGFGEIDRAYSLSLQYNRLAADIFAMKSSGMGWGQIKKQLQETGLAPANSARPAKPTKPDKPGKNKNKP
jgi:hypothetical protein